MEEKRMEFKVEFFGTYARVCLEVDGHSWQREIPDFYLYTQKGREIEINRAIGKLEKQAWIEHINGMQDKRFMHFPRIQLH